MVDIVTQLLEVRICHRGLTNETMSSTICGVVDLCTGRARGHWCHWQESKEGQGKQQDQQEPRAQLCLAGAARLLSSLRLYFNLACDQICMDICSCAVQSVVEIESIDIATLTPAAKKEVCALQYEQVSCAVFIHW